MKKQFLTLGILISLISCNENETKAPILSSKNSIEGTWKLLTGTVVEKGNTAVTDYTRDKSFIKIINNSHFAFLMHDLKRDSASGFSAGGGSYTLNGSNYTEHLEYCNAKEWEGQDFTFTVTIIGDTLIQSGIEKIESQGIDRINTEKYVRLK